MGHQLPELVSEVGERFGLNLLKLDDSQGVWRVWDKDCGQYAIKMYRQGMSSLMLGVNVHLKAGERAPGLLPTLLKTQEQYPFIYHKGNYFIGMNWIIGRKLDYFQRSDRLRAFHALIRWKAAVQGVKVPKQLQLWRKRSHILERRIQEIIECRKMALRLADDFSRIYLKDWDFYYREACLTRNLMEAREYKAVEALSEQRQEICHRDWAHHNLVLRPDGQLSVLDLEYVQGDIGILDLIDLISRFLQLDQGSPVAIPLFFNWMRRLHPLSSVEQSGFKIMFKWPEAYWMLGRQYFIEQIYRHKQFAIERYLRKVPSPRDWQNWQKVLAESLSSYDSIRKDCL